MSTLFRPSLLYRDGRFLAGGSLLADDTGVLVRNDTTQGAPHLNEMGEGATSPIDLTGKALLPGFVNTHSHCFQRLIRGKSESRVVSGKDFWSWRNTMYHAAAHLSPEDVYDVARMCFLEMVRSGTTTVGEFHYLHTAPDGTPYDDPNLLAKQVIAAAQSVGIRIVLLNSAYLRAGYRLAPDPGQRRFYETRDAFLANTADLLSSFTEGTSNVRIGVAPHSIRAVPLDDLHAILAFARGHSRPIHMHVAEQLAENCACEQEYGATPVDLLAREGLLGSDFVGVHTIHISSDEVRMFADANAIVCSCPTTERNLGDGIVPVDALMRRGVRHALGSDSQAQIDPLEDARQLDYHLRLEQQQRAILDQIGDQPLASRLFDCATINGANALGIPTGSLQFGEYADMITVDLNDLSIAGHTPEDLLPLLVFGLDRSAVRDVFVNGKRILHDGHHPLEDKIVAKYKEVHRKVWGQASASGASL